MSIFDLFKRKRANTAGAANTASANTADTAANNTATTKSLYDLISGSVVDA